MVYRITFLPCTPQTRLVYLASSEVQFVRGTLSAQQLGIPFWKLIIPILFSFCSITQVWLPGSAWEWDEITQEYYLHLYVPGQPDLNWENLEVREAVWDMMLWWLKRGTDGFRVRSLKYFFLLQ